MTASPMIACIRVEGLGVALMRQHDPAYSGVPLLLVKHTSRRSRIAAASLEVVRSGVLPGMLLSRARAIYPQAKMIAWDEAQMQRAAQQIAGLREGLWDFTHRVEQDESVYPQTGVWYLDLGRLRDMDACDLGGQLHALASTWFEPAKTGVRVTIGLAQGKFTAYAAASHSVSPVTLIPRMDAADFLAPLPVNLLPLSKETARRLSLLCIQRIGEIAVLPRAAVIRQFKREGKLLYALAQGLDSRPVIPQQMPASESRRVQFNEGVNQRERLTIILQHVADDLARRLEKRGMAARRVQLRLMLEDGSELDESLQLLQPVATPDELVRAVQRLMDTHSGAMNRTTGGIIALEVRLTQFIPNLPQQLDLFAWKPRQAQITDLMSALVARHGSRFYTAAPHQLESHLPERRFTLKRLDGDVSEAS